jgi:HK97 gp10 family phage protein
MTAGTIRLRVEFDNTARINATLASRMAALVAKAALDIEAHTKKNIAAHGLIDTGAMLASVAARKLALLRWVVEVAAHYAIYHELGTRHLPARPFLNPAAELVRPQFLGAARHLLDGAG